VSLLRRLPLPCLDNRLQTSVKKRQGRTIRAPVLQRIPQELCTTRSQAA
jgi:hypothetical protein